MKKIIVVCGNGLGSSMIVEMNAKALLKEMGREAEVTHTDLSTAKTEQADIFIGSEDIVDKLAEVHPNVVKLKNLMDKNELREALEANV
ncbi:PTS sugar transporter subunit IIB [Bacillus marinisedimentorum]|uniref:PTS sugar transporter subunit IIB n=1 Tax=Bacillus marinisedimentorum TaxID=1821260 RepID=UPI0008729D2E|nr:PTS sugar transporter subunit IIB [Bacillus marinisedimentorum]